MGHEHGGVDSGVQGGGGDGGGGAHFKMASRLAEGGKKGTSGEGSVESTWSPDGASRAQAQNLALIASSPPAVQLRREEMAAKDQRGPHWNATAQTVQNLDRALEQVQTTHAAAVKSVATKLFGVT